MNAESARQLRLLDLQAIDTRLDQIAHARATCPQLAELADLEGKAAPHRRPAGPLAHRGRRRAARGRPGRVRRRSWCATGPPATRPGSTPARCGQGPQAIAARADLAGAAAERARGHRARGDGARRGRRVRRRRARAPGVASSPSGSPRSRRPATRRSPARRRGGRDRRAAADRGRRRSAPTCVTLYEKIRALNGGTGAAALRQRRCERLPARAEPGRDRSASGCAARGRGAALRGVPPHPGPHRRVRPVTRRLIVEADGGSRGNPGPAGYGALVRDADTGEVLAERAEPLGRRPTTSRSTAG